jgi:hypothetical protein
MKRVQIDNITSIPPTYCWGYGINACGHPEVWLSDNPTLNIVCKEIILNATLPSIGNEGDIYVTSDTYKIYSWNTRSWIRDNLLDTQFVTDNSTKNLYQFYNGQLIDVDPSTITVNGVSPDENGNIEITKSDIGLSNVDNTSDINKPISTATQTALNLKADMESLYNGIYVTDCHQAPFGYSSTYDMGYINAPNTNSGWYLFRQPNVDETKSTLRAISRTVTPEIFQQNEYSSGVWGDWTSLSSSNSASFVANKGILSSVPSGAIVTDDCYVNTTDYTKRVYNGTTWISTPLVNGQLIINSLTDPVLLYGYGNNSLFEISLSLLNMIYGILNSKGEANGFCSLNENSLIEEIYIPKNLNFVFVSYMEEYDNGNSGGVKNIVLSNGINQKLTLTDNCVLSFTPPSSGTCKFQLKIVQDSVGGRSISFFDNVKNPEEFDFSAGAADQECIATFYYDGSKYIMSVVNYY